MLQSLYILVFKNEPLIKVGLAGGPRLRIAALGADRFDLSASYLVQCRDKCAVRTLERMLKTFFAEHQAAPEKELSSGNTETFWASILPELLGAIEKLRNIFPQAEFKVERDLSSLVPVQPEKRKGGRNLTPEERAARRMERIKGEILKNIKENQQKLARTEELLPKLTVQSIQILEDSNEKFSCDIHFKKGQLEIGKQLLRNTLVGVNHVDKDGRYCGLVWGVDRYTDPEEGHSWWVGLSFDLKRAESFDNGIVPNSDVPRRYLALWRAFVADKKGNSQTVLSASQPP